jgi:hypothetical protein
MLPPSKSYSPLAIALGWYRNSALRLLLLEGTAIPRRIQWILQIRAVERGRGKGAVQSWMNEGSARAAYTPAYIAHMQYREARHPWLSIFELFLFGQSWTAGLEYGIRIGKLQSQDSTSSDTSTPLSQNSENGKDVSL